MYCKNSVRKSPSTAPAVKYYDQELINNLINSDYNHQLYIIKKKLPEFKSFKLSR